MIQIDHNYCARLCVDCQCSQRPRSAVANANHDVGSGLHRGVPFGDAGADHGDLAVQVYAIGHGMVVVVSITTFLLKKSKVCFDGWGGSRGSCSRDRDRGSSGSSHPCSRTHLAAAKRGIQPRPFGLTQRPSRPSGQVDSRQGHRANHHNSRFFESRFFESRMFKLSCTPGMGKITQAAHLSSVCDDRVSTRSPGLTSQAVVTGAWVEDPFRAWLRAAWQMCTPFHLYNLWWKDQPPSIRRAGPFPAILESGHDNRRGWRDPCQEY